LAPLPVTVAPNLGRVPTGRGRWPQYFSRPKPRYGRRQRGRSPTRSREAIATRTIAAGHLVGCSVLARRAGHCSPKLLSRSRIRLNSASDTRSPCTKSGLAYTVASVRHKTIKSGSVPADNRPFARAIGAMRRQSMRCRRPRSARGGGGTAVSFGSWLISSCRGDIFHRRKKMRMAPPAVRSPEFPDF